MRIVLFILALMLTGCSVTGDSDSAEEHPAATTTHAAIEEGTTAPPSLPPAIEAPDGAWIMTAGILDDAAIPMVDGYRITFTLDGGQVGGTSACNTYGATLISEPPAFQLDEIYLTAMGCEPPAVLDSELAFLTALDRATTIARTGGKLELTGPGVDLSFEALAPVPTADLVGTIWTLETVIEGDTAASVAGEPATLELNADGTLSGSTGCRSLSGTYIVTGDEVLFTNFAADGECSEELARQDNQVVTVLGDGFTVEIDGDRLILTSSGNEGLVYRAA